VRWDVWGACQAMALGDRMMPGGAWTCPNFERSNKGDFRAWLGWKLPRAAAAYKKTACENRLTSVVVQFRPALHYGTKRKQKQWRR